MGAAGVSAVLYAGICLAALRSPYFVCAQPPGGGGGGGGGAGVDTSTLTDACDQEGTGADYSEELSGSNSTMERAVASTTGCPNHVNWEINPNIAREIASDAIIPAYPMLMASSAITDLSSAAGAVGIGLNGVSIFSSWASKQADTYETSAFYIEGDTFDLCGGHAATEGWYHYHSTPGCLQEQAMVAAGTTEDDHSPQIGWSYDGFPVYGQLGPSGVEMLLCDGSLADDTYCLDSCSGYEGELDGVDEFKYRYYTSCGFDELYFPFTTNCFRGCCPTGMTCDDHVEACDGDADEGYTADYTPVLAANLADTYETDLIEGTDADYIGDKTSYVDCSLYQGSFAASTDDDDSSGANPKSFSTSTVLAATTVVLAAAFFVGL